MVDFGADHIGVTLPSTRFASFSLSPSLWRTQSHYLKILPIGKLCHIMIFVYCALDVRVLSHSSPSSATTDNVCCDVRCSPWTWCACLLNFTLHAASAVVEHCAWAMTRFERLSACFCVRCMRMDAIVGTVVRHFTRFISVGVECAEDGITAPKSRRVVVMKRSRLVIMM